LINGQRQFFLLQHRNAVHGVRSPGNSRHHLTNLLETPGVLIVAHCWQTARRLITNLLDAQNFRVRGTTEQNRNDLLAKASVEVLAWAATASSTGGETVEVE
jgi:hypothetical protein